MWRAELKEQCVGHTHMSSMFQLVNMSIFTVV